MKTLIVYYSKTGHSRKVAEFLKEKLGADLTEIQLVKPSKSNRPQYLKLGFQAIAKVKPSIKSLSVMTTDYDLVLLGSPTWNWRPSSPVRTFFSSYPVKKVALWITAGGDGIKTMERFKKEMESRSEVVSTFIAQDSKSDTLEERLSKWVEELKSLF
jgi:flavodoxin